jgi:hypothetical protein
VASAHSMVVVVVVGSGSGSGSGSGCPPPQKQQATFNAVWAQYAEPICSYVRQVCLPPADQAAGRVASMQPLLLLVTVVRPEDDVVVTVDIGPPVDVGPDEIVEVLVLVDAGSGEPAVVVTGDDVVVKVDTGALVDVGSDDMVVVDVGSEGPAVVVVAAGMVVVQLTPEHLETLISAQFQNFSAPLLLVLGSTTS